MILEFLKQLESNPALYRLVILLIMTVIVNVSGYLENAVVHKIPYDKKKLAETLMFYTPLIALLPEVLPMGYAIGISLVLDIFKRTIIHLKGEAPKST